MGLGYAANELMKAAFFPLLATLLSTSALADMDIPVNKVTAYAGACFADHLGGGTTAANGESVIVHTVERAHAGTAIGRRAVKGTVPMLGSHFDHQNYAIAAVPQARANVSGIFGCYFKDNQNYRGITFKAGDHYGIGSNGLEKYDAAHSCMSGVYNMSKPATTIVVEGSCGGVRVRNREPIARKHRHTPRRT